jgi:hypothetical protein
MVAGADSIDDIDLWCHGGMGRPPTWKAADWTLHT